MEKHSGIKEYRTEDLIIYWDTKKCIHASMCWTGLPKVFNPWERPWIKVENATAEQIIHVIDQCPSGALTYRLAEGSKIPAAMAQGLGAKKD